MPYENDTAETAAIDIETLDLDTEQTIPVERTFLGEIIIDQKEVGKYNPQWHLAVRPLSFTLNTESGAFHNWPAIKFSSKTGELVTQGEYGRIVESIRQAFGSHKIGVGELVGLQGHFTLRKFEYGKDKKELLDSGLPNPQFGKTIVATRDSLVCTGPATPEEVAATQPAGTPAALGYSVEDVATLLSVMDGKKTSEYMKGLGRREDLSASLKNAITKGEAATKLVSMGVAEIVDGVFTRTAVAV